MDGTSGPSALGYANVYLRARPNAYAQSVTSPAASTPSPCESTTVGPCQRTLCPKPSDAGPGFDAGSGPTLGTITWTGLADDTIDGGSTVPFKVVDPDQPSAAAIFTGLEPVHVETSGGTVPAFAEDFVVPLGLLVTNPTEDVGGRKTMILHAGQDAVFTWQRGVSDVVFYFSEWATGPGNTAAQVSCAFPSEAGQGTLPAALTEKLTEINVGQVFTWRRRIARRAGYEVTTGVVFPVFDRDKKELGFLYR